MRMAIGEIPEGGASRISPLDQARHLLGCPICHMTIVGQVPRSIPILIVAHAMPKGLPDVPTVAEKNLVIIQTSELETSVLLENDVVKSNPTARWENMQFT